MFEEDGYSIYAILDDVNGLEKNAKVRASGLDIGRIEEFSFKKNKVEVKMTISKGVAIPKDSSVSLRQESMLGVKFLDIAFGVSPNKLEINGVLDKSSSYATFDETSDSINEAANALEVFIKRLDDLIAKNEQNFTELVSNFNDVGKEFKETGKIINDKLPNIMDKFVDVEDKLIKAADSIDDMSDEFKETGKTINKKLPAILTKFENIEDGVQKLINNNENELHSAIENIDNAAIEVKDAFETIDDAAKEVGDAFSKFDDYLESTTGSKLEVSFRNEYMQNDSFNKIFVGIDYSPKPMIHYLVDLVSTDDYRDDGSGKPKTTGKHEKGRQLISAQYGKDFNNLRLRGGVIESTGGIGVDYFMMHGKLVASLEAFDFNAYNDVRGDNIHTKALLRYKFLKHLNLYAGYDNFLNKDAATVTFGAGVHFIDNDLKYLLGSSSGLIK